MDRTLASVTDGSISGAMNNYVGITNTVFTGTTNKIGSGSAGTITYRMDSNSYDSLMSRTLDVGASTMVYTLIDKARGVGTALTPTNYSKATDDVEAHLTGINTALGLKANQTDLVTAQGSITTIQGQVSTLQTTSTTQGSAISTLQTDLTSAQGNITALQSSVTTVQGQVSALESASTSQGSAISTLQGDVSTLQSGLSSAEESISSIDIAVEGKVSRSGDTMSGSLSMNGNALTDLLSPTEATDAATKGYVDAVALGLKIKAPVEAKYDFDGDLSPAVPILPTEPLWLTYAGTEYSVTTEAEFDAALAAATDGDSIWVPKNTTITLTSSKTINKSIRIYGKADNSSVFTASFAVAANSGLFIIAGKKSNGTQNNDVLFYGLAITSSNSQNDHACIVANTLSAEFPDGSTGLRIERCTFNHTEFGVTIAADSWVIKHCTFNYIPESGASDTHHHLGIYNIGTTGWIEECDFKATTEATPRTIAMLLTVADYIFTPGATQSGGFSGDLVIKGCTQSSGNLRQWFVQQVFKANGPNAAPMPEHGFSLWLINNTHGTTSGGSHILAKGLPGVEPLTFFDIIYTSNNSCGESTGTDKGMIAVDAAAGNIGLGSAGAPNHFYVGAPNTGTALTTPLTNSTYDNGSDVDNLLGVNVNYFTDPRRVSNNALTVEASTTGLPLVPTGENVDVGGYITQPGDRIFVHNAADSTKSGIYVCSSEEWSYAGDWTGDVTSAFFFVNQGFYADTAWVQTNEPSLAGQTELNFVQFAGPNQYVGDGAIFIDGNVIGVQEGGITNIMLSGNISLDKLASPVYTTDQVDQLVTTAINELGGNVQNLADAVESLQTDVQGKLSLSGGTMSSNATIEFFGSTGLINGLATLTANSSPAAAVNKLYVDEAVQNLQNIIPTAGVRSSKVYAKVIQNVSAGNVIVYIHNSPSNTIDGALPYMTPNLPDSAFAWAYDVYVNGQLLRPGLDHDFVHAGQNAPDGLIMNFDLVIGDVVCVVGHTNNFASFYE
jgi:TolA-binding protein